MQLIAILGMPRSLVQQHSQGSSLCRHCISRWGHSFDFFCRAPKEWVSASSAMVLEIGRNGQCTIAIVEGYLLGSILYDFNTIQVQSHVQSFCCFFDRHFVDSTPGLSKNELCTLSAKQTLGLQPQQILKHTEDIENMRNNEQQNSCINEQIVKWMCSVVH